MAPAAGRPAPDDGLSRLTYGALASAAAKYTESWYFVALSMPVLSQQVVPCLGV